MGVHNLSLKAAELMQTVVISAKAVEKLLR